jgi:nitrate reductase gamma subunit
MNAFLAIFTYFAYVFIIVMYSVKIAKYLSLPVHLRWELYPVVHEEKRGIGSCFEQLEWWTRVREKSHIRGILYLLKEYLHLGEYARRHFSYWVVLYPWHVGFILIILFHILCFFSGAGMALGLDVSPESRQVAGRALYYVVLVVGIVSFISGAFGSIGIALKRLFDRDLRLYAAPLNYITYALTSVVFLSGLCAWYFVDPTFQEYREFWKGLVSLHFISVERASMVHIVAFDVFLMYLPYTRSMHYIARFFAFFLIRWDDEPNVRGCDLEKALIRLQGQKVTWAGPHIKPGSTWGDLVR